MTDAERRLWSRIRNAQLGFKFRRQHPIGAYVADFVCLSPKWVIELDGSQHEEQQAYDVKRDAFLKSQGFKVLRFPTNAPFLNLEGMLQVIVDQLALIPPYAPIPAFPQRGKE